MWELDVKEFFPSLNRAATMHAVDKLHSLLIEKLNRRVDVDEGLWFVLHREHKKLDGVGTGSGEQFINTPYGAIREYLQYELHHNTCFVVGNQVLEHIQGVAISGTCSAQLSGIYTMIQEHRFHSKPWPAQEYFPVQRVPVRPSRFRDNLVGQGFALQDLEAIQRFFEKLYSLNLQQEGMESRLQTLEAVLHVQPLTGHIDVSMKNKMDSKGNVVPSRRRIRYPDAYPPNARATLVSLVPALAKKCEYASTPSLFIQNAAALH